VIAFIVGFIFGFLACPFVVLAIAILLDTAP
jgi:hypothetical protein